MDPWSKGDLLAGSQSRNRADGEGDAWLSAEPYHPRQAVLTPPLATARATLPPLGLAERVAARARAETSTTVAVAALVVTAAIAAADGGHSPSTWNWATLGFAWLLILALALRDEIALGRLEIAALGSLAALVALIGLSITWSDDRPQSVLEFQRGLLYLAAVATVLLGVRTRSVTHLLGGLLGGIAVVCAYALFTRLLAPSVDALDPAMSSRLSEPIGYWNAMGIFAAMGVLLAVGLATHARDITGKAASAGALPVLTATIYLTFSRGAWIALGAGLIAAVALDPRRLRLVSTLLVVAPVSAVTVWLTSRGDALTRQAASEEAILREGQELAPLLIVLVLASIALCAALSIAARRVEVSRAASRAYAFALALVAISFLTVAFVRLGSPIELAEESYDSFASDTPNSAVRLDPGEDLGQRLSTLENNGRIEAWGAALGQWREDPWLGTGAGTFEQHWLRDRDARLQLRDAHSLYLETLGELGWIGLALLIAAFAIPLAAAIRARKRRLAGAAFGAYLAFALHAGIDWDWEIPAVTVLGLVLGASLLRMTSNGSSRRPRLRRPLRVGLALACLVLAAGSTTLLIGNRAAASAREQADAGRWAEAQREAVTATRWLPWSGEAWQQLGRAQLGLGRRQEARSSLLEAARKDPGDWSIHYDLATATVGKERRRAYRTAAALNPLGSDVENTPEAETHTDAAQPIQ